MSDPSSTVALVEDLIRLGLVGWLVLTVLALLFRWVHTRGAWAENETKWRERLAATEADCSRWQQLYERERTDRIEAQREVPETVEVLKLSIRVFDQLSEGPPKGRRKS